MKAAPRQRAKALTLPAILDIGNVQELQDSLAGALEQSPVLRLNGSKINQVSTPGVQVLLAASQSALAGGGKLILTSPSPGPAGSVREPRPSKPVKRVESGEWLSGY